MTKESFCKKYSRNISLVMFTLFLFGIICIGIGGALYDYRIDDNFRGIPGYVTNSTIHTSIVKLNSTFSCIVSSYYPINSTVNIIMMQNNQCIKFTCDNNCDTFTPLIVLIVGGCICFLSISTCICLCIIEFCKK